MKRHDAKNKNLNSKFDYKIFFKENWSAVFTLIISIVYFIWQYLNSFSWDYQSFYLGARYFFANGTYLEPLRAPLTSFLLGILSIFSWDFSPILFIMLVSLMYFYGVYLFSKLTKLDFNSLYVMSFTIVFFFYAFVNGSELLAFSLFLLFVIFLFNDNPLSGLMLGLSALTRYNILPFGIFLLFHKSWKKRIISMASYFLVLLPWFIYNYIHYGNFFASIADLYALNIIFREHLAYPFSFNVLLQFWHYLLPLFILGIVVALLSKNSKLFYKSLVEFKFSKNIDWKKLILDICLIIFSIYLIISYAKIPFKNIRYLFFLFLPTIYYCSIGLKFIVDKIPKFFISKKQLFNILVTILIIISVSISYIGYVPNMNIKNMMSDSIEILEENNLSQCQIASNAWVPMSYMGVNSIPFTRYKMTDLEQGKPLVYFKYAKDPEDQFLEFEDLKPYMIYNTSDYYIFSNGDCAESRKFNESFLQLKQKDLALVDIDLNIHSCFILFNDYNIIEGLCNLVNFNGFVYEENQIEY